MESDLSGPFNIGSEEMVTLNQLAEMVIGISKKNVSINNVLVPHTGVRGRNSDNNLIQEKLGWSPSTPLVKGLEDTYQWIATQVKTAYTKKYEKVVVGVE
jgi:nucleoside-diphosphate-sugar epimerase